MNTPHLTRSNLRRSRVFPPKGNLSPARLKLLPPKPVWCPTQEKYNVR
ncbi:hypothetical protein FHX08_006368 [Rhizobium sp. BK529]|nr:hypothetical protein [Rhizobium sp. BK529]